MVSGVLSWVFLPLVGVTLILLLGLLILWITAHWVLPADRYDIQYGLWNVPTGQHG